MTSWLDSLPEVPGDPGTVRGFAHRLGGAAEALDGHGNRLGSLVDSLVGVGWRSTAASQFASLSNSMAGDLRAAGRAYRDAAGVLAQYASALEQAQQVRAAAQQQLDQAKVEAGVVNVALPMFSGVEDFNPAVRHAHQQAEEARQYVQRMAAAARTVLETVADLPVYQPGRAQQGAGSTGRWYDSYLGFGQDFGEGCTTGSSPRRCLAGTRRRGTSSPTRRAPRSSCRSRVTWESWPAGTRISSRSR